MTDFASPDAKLMQSIRDRWSGAITVACRSNPMIPEAFLAALIANESAGNSQSQRFEPLVFGEILAVAAGKKATFDPRGIKRPIGGTDLMEYIAPTEPTSFYAGLARAVQLSTSYGLTQIMGWHCVEIYKPELLPTLGEHPDTQLALTITLLTIFANEYTLDLTKDFDDLFHCWNTGEPEFIGARPTFDLQYVPNGMKRLAIYQALAASVV